MARFFTKEEDAYIREIAPGRNIYEITRLFNERFQPSVTPANIKSYKSNHKIRSGRTTIDYTKFQAYNKLLNDEQTEYLKEIYLGIGNAECARLLNEKFGLSLTRSQVKGLKQRLKLDSGLTGRFEKGHTCSDYQFRKGKHYSPSTEFKKGSVPTNWVPIGTEIFKNGHVYIKVSDIKGTKQSHIVNWRLKRKVVWEQHNGPVPRGHVITFLDRNPKNCNIENLVCLTRSEFNYMNHNNLFYDDPELTKVGINIAKIYDVSNKKKTKKT